MPPGIRRATSLKECLYGMQNVRERFSPQGMSKERVSATLQNQASGFLPRISVIELTQPHTF